MMQNIRKAIFGLLAAGALALGLWGCGQRGAGSEQTTAEPETPVVIAMYGNLDETYIPFLQQLTETFPQIRLEYEFQWDAASEWEPMRRLLHGDGPDLFVTGGSYMPIMAPRGLLLDLTGEKFATRYHVSAMTALDQGGRVFCLPMPNDLRCLVCNRTVLRAHGIEELPQTLDELLEICRTLQEQGQGGILVDEELYSMILRTSYLCTPEGYDWLTGYNEGRGTMEGTAARQAWERMQAFAECSGCTPKDSQALPARKTNLVMSGAYAFRVVSLSNVKYMENSAPDLEIAALPFLGEGPQDQWVYYTGMQSSRYVYANAELDKPENAEKKEIVLGIMDWISTQETQQLLADCGSSALSYVNNVELDQGGIMEFIDPVIKKGHLTTDEVMGRGVGGNGGVISRCAAGMLAGETDAAGAVAACDDQNKAFAPQRTQPGMDDVIGTALEHISWRKPAAVTVGAPAAQLAAQAMAEAFPEADFAFAMAKNTATSIYPGEITLFEAIRCADGEQDRELVLVEATGKQIRAVMEAGIGTPVRPDFVKPYGISGAGRLLHPAGLTYRADVTREPGDKITEIRLDGGGELEPEKLYTIAVSGLLVDVVAEPNFKDCQIAGTGKYLRDVLVDYIRAHGEISAPEPGFTVSGAQRLYEAP